MFARRSHRSVNIRERRCGHARRERGRVEFMIRVQHENRVQHPDRQFCGTVP